MNLTDKIDVARSVRETKVYDIGPVSKAAVFEAVTECVRYWPNAHLGSIPPREDIAAAFRMIRRRIAQGQTVYAAAIDIQHDAARYYDM